MRTKLIVNIILIKEEFLVVYQSKAYKNNSNISRYKIQDTYYVTDITNSFLKHTHTSEKYHHQLHVSYLVHFSFYLFIFSIVNNSKNLHLKITNQVINIYDWKTISNVDFNIKERLNSVKDII